MPALDPLSEALGELQTAYVLAANSRPSGAIYAAARSLRLTLEWLEVAIPALPPEAADPEPFIIPIGPRRPQKGELPL